MKILHSAIPNINEKFTNEVQKCSEEFLRVKLRFFLRQNDKQSFRLLSETPLRTKNVFKITKKT